MTDDHKLAVASLAMLAFGRPGLAGLGGGAPIRDLRTRLNVEWRNGRLPTADYLAAVRRLDAEKETKR